MLHRDTGTPSKDSSGGFRLSGENIPAARNVVITKSMSNRTLQHHMTKGLEETNVSWLTSDEIKTVSGRPQQTAAITTSRSESGKYVSFQTMGHFQIAGRCFQRT